MTKRKPGRPRTANPRTKRVTTSYTEAEYEVLAKAAKDDLPGYIRDAALLRAYSA